MKEVEALVPVLFRFPFFLKKQVLSFEKAENGFYRVNGKLFFLQKCTGEELFLLPLLVFTFLVGGALFSIYQSGHYSCLLGLLPATGYYLSLRAKKVGTVFFFLTVLAEFLCLYLYSFSPAVLPALYLFFGGIVGVSLTVAYGRECYLLCRKEKGSLNCWPVFIT